MSGLGIPLSVSSSTEFLALPRTLRASLNDADSPLALMAGALPQTEDGLTAVQQLQRSFTNFEADLQATPANSYIAIYTPARLRAKLMEMGVLTAPAALVTPQP